MPNARVDDASVEPRIQIGTQVQDAVSKSDISRPLPAGSPLGERTACADEGECRISRAVVTVVIEAAHRHLPAWRCEHPNVGRIPRYRKKPGTISPVEA